MKKLLLCVIVLLLLGSTSKRVQERRDMETAARELGISADSLVRKVVQLEALARQLRESE